MAIAKSLRTALGGPAWRQARTAACMPASSFASSSRALSQPAPETSTKFGTKKKTVSSCAAGTTLTGLSILRDKPDPKALPDEDYPDWLWTILPSDKNKALADKAKQKVKAGHEFDFAQEKKRLRAVNKQKIKATNLIRST